MSDIRWLEAGACLFAEGDRGDSAYFIEKGVIDIVVERDGAVIQLARRGAGEIIGEMALIDGRPRSATAMAAEDCQLVKITEQQIFNRSKQLDPVLDLCMQTVLERFRKTLSNFTVPLAASSVDQNDNVPAGNWQVVEALRQENELANAIKDGQLELYLQPIVKLPNREYAGYEALARWRHPDRGLIGPDNFIPLAEDSGLIVELTRWVVGQSMQCRANMRRAPSDLFISINVSTADLLGDHFLPMLQGKLNDCGVNAEKFKLEVTESALMDEPERAAGVLERCRDMGFGIAIDDFGTGYSSFNYLYQYPAHFLKIDRSFVSGVSDDPRSRQLVKAMSGMAAGLGMEVVAEGVETEAQADFLSDHNCALGQGFLFGKPRSANECLHLTTLAQGERRQNRQKPTTSSTTPDLENSSTFSKPIKCEDHLNKTP